MSPIRRLLLCGAALFCAAAAASHAADAPPATPGSAPSACAKIKAIEVRGNQKMSADAVRFDLGLKVGDAWDDAAVRQEFRRFWAKGYFADLRFARRCEADGAVLVVEIRERPTLLTVTYAKNSAFNQTQIEDYFKERSFTMTVGTPLDRKKLWRAEELIKEYVGQKGYLDAVVKADIREVTSGSRAVTFRVTLGGKTRIRKITFAGNKAFSSRTLTGELKLTSAWKFYWPWGRKSLYHPLRYQQDVNNILEYYRDRGFLDVDVKPPIVDIQTVKGEKQAEHKPAAAPAPAEPAAKNASDRDLERLLGKGNAAAEEEDTGSKERKWVYIRTPVLEGPVYHLREVRFVGNTVIPAEKLRRMVPLRDGAVVSDGALEAGIGYMRAAYGRKGYVYASVTRRFEKDKDKQEATVVYEVEEDQAYAVRRIEFAGNTQTNDEVLRREMKVQEGELLDRSQLDRSMQRMQQIGFWVPSGEPTLEPVPDKPQVDVKVQGEEQNRSEIQVGGGYSELEGGFFLASYETKNFLGRGESLGLFVAVGSRSNQASLSFTEPWFMGKPNTLGMSIYRRGANYGSAPDAYGNYQNLTEVSTGGSLTIGRRVGDFTQLQLTYGYQSALSDTFDLSSRVTRTRTRIAYLSPLFSYKAVNNYLRPTAGYELRVIPQIATRLLGGDNDYFRPMVQGTIYVPLGTHLFAALHGEFGGIFRFGSLRRDSGFIDGVPRFQRFYLGGDMLGPRVFETRSLTAYRWRVLVDTNGNPQIDANGNPRVYLASVGGSKMGLLQFEFGVPIGKTATLAAFADAGGVYDNGEPFTWSRARVSAGLEFRVFLPVFQAPIRLIYGWPVKELKGDQTSNFQFSIGLPF